MQDQTTEILGMMRRITSIDSRRDIVVSNSDQPGLGTLGPVQMRSQPANRGTGTMPEAANLTRPAHSQQDTAIYGEAPRRGPFAQIIKVFDLPSRGHVRDPVEWGLVDLHTMALAWDV